MPQVHAAPIVLLRFSVRVRARLIKTIRAIFADESSPRRATQSGAVVSPLDAVGRLLDFFFATVAAANAVTIINLTRTARANPTALFTTPAKTMALIIGHVYIFWAMDRSLPAGLSYYTFAMPAFALWNAFATAFHKGIPKELALQSFRGRKVGFPIMAVSNMVVEVLLVIVGIVLSYVWFYLLDDRYDLGVIYYFNIPMFVSLLFFAHFLGIAFGAFMHILGKIVPIIASFTHIMLPVMFLTSGAYTSFTQQPESFQLVTIYNFVTPIVEFGRTTLDPHYFTSNLTLLYPAGVFFACYFLSILVHRVEKP